MTDAAAIEAHGLGAVAWSLGLIAVFAPLSIARYRRAVTG